MAESYVVTVESSGTAFGPFDDNEEAHRFARFLTIEVDPAYVHVLWPPLPELLNWRDSILREDSDADPF